MSKDLSGQSAWSDGSMPVSRLSSPVEALLDAGILKPPVHPGQLAYLQGYQILEVAGQGGMGIVLLATSEANGTKVAIKVLRPELIGKQEALDRFGHEILVMQRLSHSHPNILPILAAEAHSKTPYYVTPWIENGSLARRIRQSSLLSNAETRAIAIQVAEALAHAHANGEQHRDIKPANILIDQQGSVYVCDFGLGLEVTANPHTLPGQRIRAGTAPYMSPQAVAGMPEGKPDDIYSFGAVLYEMLTARPPFAGSSDEVVWSQIAAGPPTAIRTINPRAQVSLAEVSERAMARELPNRYMAMTDVLEDLHRIKHRKRPKASQAARKVARSSKRTFTGAIILLACVAAILFAWPWLVSRSPAVREQLMGSPVSTGPLRLVVSQSTVAAYDRGNKTVYRVQVQGEVVAPKLLPIGPHGEEYLVLGVRDGTDAGLLILYDEHGVQLWKRQTADGDYAYNSGSVNQMNIVDVAAADFWGDGVPRIAAISNDRNWLPSKVTLWNISGKLEATYWHPGQLQRLQGLRPSTENRSFILAWGCNNAMTQMIPGSNRDTYYHAIVCLDPLTMNGEAPPRLGRLKRGREAWYALVMPQEALILGITLKPPAPGAPEGSPGQQLQVETTDEVFLFLDENGRLVSRGAGHEEAARKLTRTVLLAHDGAMDLSAALRSPGR